MYLTKVLFCAYVIYIIDIVWVKFIFLIFIIEAFTNLKAIYCLLDNKGRDTAGGGEMALSIHTLVQIISTLISFVRTILAEATEKLLGNHLFEDIY